ncbi:glycosyltransferase [Thermodesulfobacteriota bacterium]
MNSKNIGFISTRFAGIDGVSLEASKWAQVFEENDHRCFWFAGELDRDPAKSFLVPEAHFKHSQNEWIYEQVFCSKKRKPSATEVIHVLKSLLKVQLHCFIDQFKIDLLIVENALTIPMHIPLGLSLTEVIAEIQIPTIAHHHDFCWERPRYLVNGMNDYLLMAFPPKLPNLKHVVINSEAKEQLAFRTGISSTIIPNVLDFDNPPLVNEKKTKAFRESIGLKPDDKIILQPTRIIERKGIEHTIDLVKALDDPCYKLVISHETGDEGFEYSEWLKAYALEHQVDLRMVKTKITNPWINNGKHQTEHSLWDIYPNAEFISYPSFCEGFGNGLLEAIYFKKPLLVNRYPIFVKDIEPKGFNLAVMDGFLSEKIVQNVKEILESPARREKTVNLNYEVASRHYSYSVLRNHLNSIVNEIISESEQRLSNKQSGQDNVISLTIDPSPANADSLYEKYERYVAR